MKYFDNLSIKNKLTIIILFVGIFSLVLGFTIEVVSDIKNFRKEMVTNTIMIAEVIGEYSLSDLIFEDKSAAEQTLAKLDKISYIKNAVIYDADGKIFSVYNKPGFDATPPERLGEPSKFDGRYLSIFQPIVNYENSYGNYGTLYLRASTELLNKKISDHIFIMFLLIVVSMIVSYFLAVKLQGVISRPILHLANVAKSISEKGDYSVRVKKTGQDETRILYTGFNDMLDQIQRREIERDNAMENLRDSEEKYRALVENAADFIHLVDQKGNVLSLNNSAAAIIGKQPEEIIGKDLSALFPQETVVHFIDDTKKIFKTGKGDTFESQMKIGNSKLWISTRLDPVWDDKGRVVAVMGVTRDITESKRTEAALEKSEKKYRNLVNNALVGIYRSNIKGDILYVNEAIVQMFEFDSVEEFISEGSLARYKNIKDREIFLNNIKKTGKVESYEIEYLTKFGKTVNVLVSTKLEGDELSGMFLDITERKRTEVELNTYRNHLEDLVKERTSELESFTYSVSHDLRAPIRAIDGFSKILMEDYTDVLDDEGKRLLGIITGNTKKMGQLIDDLLRLSRLGQKEMVISKVNMNMLINEVQTDAMKTVTGRSIKWKLNNLHPAEGDTAMIRQVWANLISNAVKFTRLKKKAVIEIDSKLEDKETVYFIKDNGVGFDMKYADKLFGVFQRLHTDEEFEGTGVGLAIVKRIIQRHGGRIYANGKIDEGATFYFTLLNERN